MSQFTGVSMAAPSAPPMYGGDPGAGTPYRAMPVESAPQPSVGEVLSLRFQELRDQLEMRDDYVHKLSKFLAGRKVILVIDDSGSMQMPSDCKLVPRKPTGFPASRWDEAMFATRYVIRIAAALSPDEGIDVYFLNRPALFGVRFMEQLDPCFGRPPAGLTPLNTTMKSIISANRAAAIERGLSILVMTDGRPSDGHDPSRDFKALLRSREMPERTPVSILACTDDDGVMDFLNDVDVRCPSVDVVDDYESEKKEIQKVQGHSYRFTYCDYIAKSMLGAVDPEMDRLDEAGCCVLL